MCIRDSAYRARILHRHDDERWARADSRRVRLQCLQRFRPDRALRDLFAVRNLVSKIQFSESRSRRPALANPRSQFIVNQCALAPSPGTTEEEAWLERRAEERATYFDCARRLASLEAVYRRSASGRGAARVVQTSLVGDAHGGRTVRVVKPSTS